MGLYTIALKRIAQYYAQLYNRTIALMHAPICLGQLMALMAEMALTAEIGGGPILAMVEGGAELV